MTFNDGIEQEPLVLTTETSFVNTAPDKLSPHWGVVAGIPASISDPAPKYMYMCGLTDHGDKCMVSDQFICL